MAPPRRGGWPAAGAKLAIGYSTGADRARALADALPGAGHLTLRMPMESSATLRAAAAEVEARLGRCDVLVNSAATTRTVPHADLEALRRTTT